MIAILSWIVCAVAVMCIVEAIDRLRMSTDALLGPLGRAADALERIADATEYMRQDIQDFDQNITTILGRRNP